MDAGKVSGVDAGPEVRCAGSSCGDGEDELRHSGGVRLRRIEMRRFSSEGRNPICMWAHELKVLILWTEF
jgi:hypothetical protein